MLSPNVLLHSELPVVRRQVEAALLSQSPHTTLFEATDWHAAEMLAEQHALDIIIVTHTRLGPVEVDTLIALRRLQPGVRMILLTLDPLPADFPALLDRLDISPVSLRHLAGTLLRPPAFQNRGSPFRMVPDIRGFAG